MPIYVYYGNVVVATIDGKQVDINKEAVEHSGMPPQWVPNIAHLLENALPEGQRYDALIRLAIARGKSPNSSIELIPYVTDLPGRFSAEHSSMPRKNGEDERKFFQLPEHLPQGSIESRLPAALFNPLSEVRVNERPSFSGYQDKFTANLLLEGEKLILLPVDQEAERGNVIVKPANLKYPFIAENEYVCMELSRQLEIPTSRVFLFYQADTPFPRQHLAVERFDVNMRDGRAEKLAITEFAPLMKLLPDQKYDATTESLFAFARDNLSSDDTKLLARYYLLGVIVRNGDMHTKNFSIMIDPNGNPRLTPVYDMVNTDIYGFSDILALKLTNDNRPKAPAIAAFLSQYLTPDEIAGMGQAVKGHLSGVLDSAFEQNTALNAPKFKKRLEQSISGGASHTIQAAKQLSHSLVKRPKDSQDR